MKLLKRMVALLFVLYLLYLTKSALGINLSHRYSAPAVFKLPIKQLMHWS
ncbi:MAG TPA: hypothetical protein V6C78_05845 [Crinalium sp.]